ncbi:MAG: polyphenol oxidase family protein [Bradyrhizobiaceae bacterium]|nr:polyphenol oxidase family protein [Bradyrhizobiaceae bacterium]
MNVTNGNAGYGVVCGLTHRDGTCSDLGAYLDVAPDHFHSIKQVHGTAVALVDQAAVGNGCHADNPDAVQADALITNIPSAVLIIRVADCCGIVLHDPNQRTLAAVHSGWRGTAKGVTSAAIASMQTHFDSDPSHLHAWLSPCASVERYQVGADVHAVLGKYCRKDPLQSNRWYFDNKRAIHEELLANGLHAENITVDPSCTIGDLRFHSYRRDKESAGRGLVFARLIDSTNTQ